MIYYEKYQDNRSNSLYPGKWYARAVATETVELDALAEHMANHNTPFSKGAVKGMLTDMVQCIRELVLEGKCVKLPDLAIFSVGLVTKPADSAEKFSAASNVVGFRLRARATGDLRPAEFKSDVKVTELTVYDGGKTASGGSEEKP